MLDWLFGWISKPEYTWTFAEDRLPQLVLGVLILAILLGASWIYFMLKYDGKEHRK